MSKRNSQDAVDQFFSKIRRHRSSSLVPEAQLMLAVFQDAAKCYVGSAQKRHTTQICREAEAWLFDGDRRLTFSFENICFMLSLAPEPVRQALRGMKEAAEVTSRRHSFSSPETNETEARVAAA